jgi:hypothetical protein
MTNGRQGASISKTKRNIGMCSSGHHDNRTAGAENFCHWADAVEFLII